MKSFANPAQMVAPAPEPNRAGGLLGTFGDQLLNKGEGLLQQAAANVKMLIPSQRDLLITTMVESLMDHKPRDDTDSFAYFDAKALDPNNVVRLRSPFKQCIAFVVGGGCHPEACSLAQWAKKKGKVVVYGSTDLVSPTDFVEQELSFLGRSM